MQERRKTTRRRTLLAGRVEIEKLNGWAVDCTVRNLSDAGARVAMGSRVVVPQTFEMRISGAAPVPARLVWYRDGQAGVALAAADADMPSASDRAHAVAAATDATDLPARIRAIIERTGAGGKRLVPGATLPQGKTQN